MTASLGVMTCCNEVRSDEFTFFSSIVELWDIPGEGRVSTYWHSPAGVSASLLLAVNSDGRVIMMNKMVRDDVIYGAPVVAGLSLQLGRPWMQQPKPSPPEQQTR